MRAYEEIQLELLVCTRRVEHEMPHERAEPHKRASGSYRDHQREFWGVFLGESEESERVLPRSRSEVSREFSQVERSEQLGPTAFTEEVSFRKFFQCIELSKNAVESERATKSCRVHRRSFPREEPSDRGARSEHPTRRARPFPSANKTKNVCAPFAASVRASPHDRRPDPLFGMQLRSGGSDEPFERVSPQ